MNSRQQHFLHGPWRLCRLRTAGFTLVEIMVVVIVMALMAGMLMPNLGGTAGTMRLNASARRIASLFDYCRQSAVATGQVHGIVFDNDNGRFEVVREEPIDEETSPDAPPTLTPVSLPGVLDPELPEGVSLASVSAFDTSIMSGDEDEEGFRILFFPDGTTEFATIKLTLPNGDGRKIELNGLSGDVSIERLDSDEMEETQEEAEEE